jgi:hypothetical protein
MFLCSGPHPQLLWTIPADYTTPSGLNSITVGPVSFHSSRMLCGQSCAEEHLISFYRDGIYIF